MRSVDYRKRLNDQVGPSMDWEPLGAARETLVV